MADHNIRVEHARTIMALAVARTHGRFQLERLSEQVYRMTDAQYVEQEAQVHQQLKELLDFSGSESRRIAREIEERRPEAERLQREHREHIENLRRLPLDILVHLDGRRSFVRSDGVRGFTTMPLSAFSGTVTYEQPPKALPWYLGLWQRLRKIFAA